MLLHLTVTLKDAKVREDGSHLVSPAMAAAAAIAGRFVDVREWL